MPRPVAAGRHIWAADRLTLTVPLAIPFMAKVAHKCLSGGADSRRDEQRTAEGEPRVSEDQTPVGFERPDLLVSYTLSGARAAPDTT